MLQQLQASQWDLAPPCECGPANQAARACSHPGTSDARLGKIKLVAERSTVHRSNDNPSRAPKSQTGEVLNLVGIAAKDIDDAALARAGMLGQEWAHRQIWYRFAPMVYALLRRSLGGRHDPEDLLQEVFLRVFERLETLENPSALRSFVYSFAVRVVSEELRRHRVRSRLAALFLAPAAERWTAHVDFESRELLGRIQGVLDQMNDRIRTVFVLRRFDGVALTEIASGLGLSLATVKRDLDKANGFISQAIHRDERLRDELMAGAAQNDVESKP
jgi:RNA polymerase sigma-70 factor, ECF subfamily